MTDRKFPFTVDGQQYHLGPLDLDTKIHIADLVTVDRIRSAARRFAKKLTTAEEYLAEQQVANVKWGGKPITHELQQNEEAQRVFIRATLIETVDDATLTRLMQSDEILIALKMMQEDDDPKVTTPPVSGLTPTGGEPSS